MSAATKSKMGSYESSTEFHNYRTVSKAAVCCIVFAILGLISFVSPVFVILPLIGVICGISAMMTFHKFPNEMIGRLANVVGLGVALVGLVGSVGYHAYVYRTEVPEGYQRISFSQLKPSKRDQLDFSSKALEFNKTKVFVKGYTRPGEKKHNLKSFILVGDFAACCFGGNPKITDVIAVSIVSDDTVDYSYRLRRIGGEFRLHENRSAIHNKDIPAIYYEIVADHVK